MQAQQRSRVGGEIGAEARDLGQRRAHAAIEGEGGGRAHRRTLEEPGCQPAPRRHRIVDDDVGIEPAQVLEREIEQRRRRAQKQLTDANGALGRVGDLGWKRLVGGDDIGADRFQPRGHLRAGEGADAGTAPTQLGDHR